MLLCFKNLFFVENPFDNDRAEPSKLKHTRSFCLGVGGRVGRFRMHTRSAPDRGRFLAHRCVKFRS